LDRSNKKKLDGSRQEAINVFACAHVVAYCMLPGEWGLFGEDFCLGRGDACVASKNKFLGRTYLKGGRVLYSLGSCLWAKQRSICIQNLKSSFSGLEDLKGVPKSKVDHVTPPRPLSNLLAYFN